ncbi:MAG TPA: hypothetical protein VEJ18_00145 [Planctomycetota bacterium]|nr:hypothetical protein [Planctomycetota bacterium]
MGKPIVYCSTCGAGLREATHDRVVQLEGKIFCAKCRPAMPAETPKPFRRDDPPRPASRGGSGTRRVPHVHETPRSFAMRQASPRSPLLAIAVGVSAFLLVLIVAAASARSRRPPAPPAPPPPPPPRAVAPRPVVPLPPPPAPPETKEDHARELAELDAQTAALEGQEEFKGGIDFLEAARKRKSTPDWTEAIDQRMRDFNARAMARFSALAEEALKAPPERVAEIRRKIQKWGRPDFVEELERRLDAGRPWEKVFDGTSNEFLRRLSKECWKVRDGVLVNEGPEDAAQTARQFKDGELRIRFAVDEPQNVFFCVRQGGDAPGSAYKIDWSVLKRMIRPGQPHELVIVFRGEAVSATLDGRPVAIVLEGKKKPTVGGLQFNGRERVRVFAIEYRP